MADPDAEKNREAFAFHCSVANGTYPEIAHLTANYRLRSQLIASAGYEAFLQHLADQEKAATAG